VMLLLSTVQMLRLPECYNDIHRAVPCALDEATNLELIQGWIDSWGVLERLYEAGFVHAIGVDGIEFDVCRVREATLC
jgi:diketogulonate reductase-like aldo/keto reductase